MTLTILFSLILSIALVALLWPQRRHRQTVIIITGVFFAGSFGIYHMIGSPEIVPLLAKRSEKLSELKASILTHSTAVKADPKNIESWISLGADFMQTGQYGAAANAFKQSVVLSGGNPALILAYGRALILAADDKVTDDAKKSLEMVLLQDPKNAEARYWLIVRTLQDGDNANAMKEMKALYRELPDESPVKTMIDRQIGR